MLVTISIQTSVRNQQIFTISPKEKEKSEFELIITDCMAFVISVERSVITEMTFLHFP
jgi:hypothetical protein